VTEQPRPAFEAASRLRRALERASAALANADLEALLQSEAELELAIKSVRVPGSLPPEERAVIRREAEDARRALARCRTLGGVLLDTVRLTFEAQGRATGYGPREAAPAVPGRTRVNTIG
jgi:hypothetical protein